MRYCQLTNEERHTLDVLLNLEKMSLRSVAKRLGRSPATISREVKRNSINGYYAFNSAQVIRDKKSAHKHSFKNLKYSEFTALFVSKYDKRCYGVGQTVKFIKDNHPEVLCPTARHVYNMMNSWNWALNKKDRLKRYYVKGRKRKIGDVGQLFRKYVIPYELRPHYINDRQEAGHFEGDLVMGQKTHGNEHVFTMVDRKTRMLYVAKTPSKDPWKVMSVIKKMIQSRNILIKSLTVDNGTEFETLGLLAKWLNIKVYVCAPYCSFQRGTNENANGVLRRFYKKGTIFNQISQSELEETARLINSMPRPTWGYKSALQIEGEEKCNPAIY